MTSAVNNLTTSLQQSMMQTEVSYVQLLHTVTADGLPTLPKPTTCLPLAFTTAKAMRKSLPVCESHYHLPEAHYY